MSRAPSIEQIRTHFLRLGGTHAASQSERLLLDLVRRSSHAAGTDEHPTTLISRADLTRACGFSVPGAKGLIDGLVERGLLKLGPPTTKSRGQPSASVSLAPEFAYSFGLSIMVDGFRLALTNFAGTVLNERFFPEFPLELESVANLVQKSIQEMLEANHIEPDAVFGIGVSMTGPYIGHGSRVNPPLTLPEEWANTELDTFFAERLQHPVWMDNDANCAATAEILSGVGRRTSNFVYLHFTDGLGSGVVQGGRIVHGAHGNAGEIGRLFALAGLPRITLESLRTQLVEAKHDLPNLNSMLDHYDPNWPEIETWIESVQRSMSLTVAAIVALLDPEIIVFGARLPKDLAQRLIARIQFETSARRGTPAPNPLIIVAEAPPNSTVIGAATLPFKEHFFL